MHAVKSAATATTKLHHPRNYTQFICLYLGIRPLLMDLWSGSSNRWSMVLCFCKCQRQSLLPSMRLFSDMAFAHGQVQKKRSKDASKQVDLTANDALREQLRETRATQFQGYEDVSGAGAVVAILRHGEMVSSAHEGNSHTHI